MDTKLIATRAVQDLEELLYHFPLASAIREQVRLAERAQEEHSDHLRRIGDPGRHFWDTPAELLYDEVGVHLGAMFVLLQAGITETISIVNRIYNLHGNAKNKPPILRLEATTSVSGLSYPEIANAAANYFKHRHEWPQIWADAKPFAKKTINLVSRVGMSASNDVADNLYHALDAITDRANAKALPTLVVEDWRLKLAARLRGDYLSCVP